jgi:transcriptional regulator with XRE-family HTH domain
VYDGGVTEHRDLGNKEAFDPAELVRRLDAKRRSENKSLRDVSDATGVSVPTLSRVLRGHVPERENLLRLTRWVGMTIGPMTAREARNRAAHADVGTVEAVELHLRADKNLSGADAEALADLFKIAYDRLRVRRDRE